MIIIIVIGYLGKNLAATQGKFLMDIILFCFKSYLPTFRVVKLELKQQSIE